MLRQGRGLLLSSLLVLVALAGCAGDADLVPLAGTPAVDTAVIKDGRDLRFELLATDELTEPSWKVGDWFGHHLYFGVNDTTGNHYQTIVTQVKSDSYFLATDDAEAAKDEAAFDIPIMGDIKKKNLEMKAFGESWDWMYQFPLKEKKTWKKDVRFDAEFDGTVEAVPTTFTVSYANRITTPDGDRPGFEITGVTGDGKTFLQYDFVPDIGWYAHFYMYNLQTPDLQDYFFHSMSMGRGTEWTGTYFVDAAEVVADHQSLYGVNPGPPPEAYTEAVLVGTFTMKEGSTYAYGYLWSFAFAGAHDTILVDPKNQAHEFRAVGTPQDFKFEFVDAAAIPGEWKILTVGAGVVVSGGVFMWEITEKSFTL